MTPTPKEIKNFISGNIIICDGHEYISNAEKLVMDVRKSFENTYCGIEQERNGCLHFVVKILYKNGFRKCVDYLVLPPEIHVQL